MENITRGGMYLVIPASVAEDVRLRERSKLIYGRIVQLASSTGFCYASNQALLEILSHEDPKTGEVSVITERTLQSALAELRDRGHIHMDEGPVPRSGGEGTVVRRRIFVGRKLADMPPPQGGAENFTPENFCTPGVKKISPPLNSKNNTSKNIPPMDDLRSGFGDLMISQEEFDKSFLELNQAFEAGEKTEAQYKAALEQLIGLAYGAEGAERAKYAAMLAGQEAMSGMLAIVSASEEDYQKLTEAIYNCDGAAEEFSEIANDNLAGSLKTIGSVGEAIGLALYEKFQEPLRDVADSLKNEALPAIKEFISSIDTEAVTEGVTDFLNAMREIGRAHV